MKKPITPTRPVQSYNRTKTTEVYFEEWSRGDQYDVLTFKPSNVDSEIKLNECSIEIDIDTREIKVFKLSTESTVNPNYEKELVKYQREQQAYEEKLVAYEEWQKTEKKRKQAEVKAIKARYLEVELQAAEALLRKHSRI